MQSFDYKKIIAKLTEEKEALLGDNVCVIISKLHYLMLYCRCFHNSVILDISYFEVVGICIMLCVADYAGLSWFLDTL